MTGSIFVVDDDEFVRDSLSALLQAKGYKVLAFASAEAFLLGFQPTSQSCAIIDVRLPGMDGVGLLEHLRQKGVSLPVLMVTGHADVPLAVRAMKVGASDFIEKPYTNAALLAAIERASESAPVFSSPGNSDEIRQRIASLTPREREILEQLVIGHPNKGIARNLGISPRTVEIHRANLMKKMDADTLSHLVRMALSAGFSGADQQGSPAR